MSFNQRLEQYLSTANTRDKVQCLLTLMESLKESERELVINLLLSATTGQEVQERAQEDAKTVTVLEEQEHKPEERAHSEWDVNNPSPIEMSAFLKEKKQK